MRIFYGILAYIDRFDVKENGRLIWKEKAVF